MNGRQQRTSKHLSTVTLTESKNTILTRQKLKGLIFSLMPNNKR
jgi:hypothetical protein